MPMTAASFAHDAQAKTRVTLLGAVINLLLAAGKAAVGVLGQSQALVADAVHSLSDLVSDVLVLVASRLGSRDADSDHPYGHARFETVATVAIGLLLLAAAAGFVYDAIMRLMNPQRLLIPDWIVLPAALLSVASKEGLYRYTLQVARRVRSPLIEANAWHHRSDALSSAVVIVGVAGALAGVVWFDALATIIVAVMVGAVGGRFVGQALRELVDAGADADQLEVLRQTIESVPGVLAHHELRTRLMGGQVLVDVHILVDRWLSVSEGHRIAEEVRYRLLQHVPSTMSVLVHVDVEEHGSDPSRYQRLPLRETVLRELHKAWEDVQDLPTPQRVVLHYHGERLTVELVLPMEALPGGDPDALARRLESAASGLAYLEKVIVLAGGPLPAAEPSQHVDQQSDAGNA